MDEEEFLEELECSLNLDDCIIRKAKLNTSWYAIEPGDATRYYIGVSECPSVFFPGADDSYLHVVLRVGGQTTSYELRKDRILKPRSTGSYSKGEYVRYVASKMGVGLHTAAVLILFLRRWITVDGEI